MNFKLYQVDVKSVFLNEFIKKTIYVKQPPSFEHEKCWPKGPSL